MNKMKNVFNWALPQGQGAFSKGAEDIGKSGDYWSKIMSGNRAAVSSAVAPETNIIRTAADARKRQLATSGTARGGGTAAVNQQMDTDTASKVDNAIFGARPQAAQEVAGIGRTEMGVGAGMVGMAGETATNLSDIAMKSRGQSHRINQEMVGKVTGAIDSALGAIFG